MGVTHDQCFHYTQSTTHNAAHLVGSMTSLTQPAYLTRSLSVTFSLAWPSKIFFPSLSKTA